MPHEDRNAVTGQTAGDSRESAEPDLTAAAEGIFGPLGGTWANGHEAPLAADMPDPETVLDDDGLGPMAAA